MSLPNWQPSATIDCLKQRANILAKIRTFFSVRDVVEVETPALSAASVTDMHLSAFETQFVGPGYAEGLTLYLQTSPEYAMKRLLAAGSGPIYQIAKAFRNEEAGRHHNPEFTLLEWYRPDFDEFQLMTEVEALLKAVLGCPDAMALSYQAVFIEHLSIDPLTASVEALQSIAAERGHTSLAKELKDKDTLLQLLFCLDIEPHIGQEQPCFVYHFPASQAALAQLCEDDPRVAGRFELYYRGMELANGFHELTDPAEQYARFSQDNQQRQKNGLPEMAIDQHLLDALHHGLPACAGVALGIDRLVMLATEQPQIQNVVAFDISRA